MSEERSWAEDTVELAAAERRAPSKPEGTPAPRRGLRPGRSGAAAAIGVVGVALVVFTLPGGGGVGRERPGAIKAEPEHSARIEIETAIPPRRSYLQPVRRRAGSLAIGLSRRAPKPRKPKPAPPPAAPKAAPVYEAAPEPAPAPEASPAPARETPAAVEFGM